MLADAPTASASLDRTVKKKKRGQSPKTKENIMHFLGAVITERREDLEGVLEPWSEYNDVPEYIVKTREEFLAECRHDDEIILLDPEGFHEQAAMRLELDDEKALKTYAERYGVNLDEDGNVISTFNEDSFYDYWVPADEWETEDGHKLGDHQGKTCREILDRHHGFLKGVSVIVADGTYEGGFIDSVTDETIERIFRNHLEDKVWWVNFHE